MPIKQLKNLDDFNYGEIRRQFVIDLLMCSEEGAFLVRNATDSSELVLSVLWKNEVKHFQPNFDGKNYDFGARGFSTPFDLINFHYSQKVPIIGSDKKTRVYLKTPKIREKTIFEASDIKVQAKLGEGNFGKVYKVKISSTGRPAAMKTLHASVPREVREMFTKEFNMMNTMKHENIVRCIGIVADDGNDTSNTKILLELINKGSLEKLLRDMKLTDRGKSRILLDVAQGMQYLHARSVIHRDLAARNILVQRNEDGTIVGKVSDFGLSQKDEKGNGYCLQNFEQLPLKWLAPECLREMKWTSASDVWSFGVLMWEVWTNGGDPYSNIATVTNVKSLKKYIASGGNPLIPDSTPPQYGKVMAACWTVDPRSRPNMDWVLAELTRIHNSLYSSNTERCSAKILNAPFAHVELPNVEINISFLRK